MICYFIWITIFQSNCDEQRLLLVCTGRSLQLTFGISEIYSLRPFSYLYFMIKTKNSVSKRHYSLKMNCWTRADAGCEKRVTALQVTNKVGFSLGFSFSFALQKLNLLVRQVQCDKLSLKCICPWESALLENISLKGRRFLNQLRYLAT